MSPETLPIKTKHYNGIRNSKIETALRRFCTLNLLVVMFFLVACEQPQEMSMPKTTVHGIWGSGPNDIWIARTQKDLANLLHYDGLAITNMQSPMGNTTYLGLWGSSSDNVWLVGQDTSEVIKIARWNGSTWLAVPDISSNAFWVSNLWINQPNDVWLVGYWDRSVGLYGFAAHWDGTTWAIIESPDMRTPYAVWGNGSGDIWIFADNPKLIHGDGKIFKEENTPQNLDIYDVWGNNAKDAWAVGTVNVLHWDGTSWTIAAGPSEDWGWLSRVHGVDANNVWAIAAFPFGGSVGGQILHWDGVSWSYAPTPKRLTTIWAASAGDVWAGASEGTILRWNGKTWFSVIE